MLEFVQVTAQYSNAVLVAILPHIASFSAKLELPTPAPVALQHVKNFKCSPKEGDVGGSLTLANGIWMAYQNGHVVGLRTPRSYYNLQNPEHIPAFYGDCKLTPDEALEMARDSIRKAGYGLVETFADQKPRIDLPPKFGDKTVPHYRFEWRDPVFDVTAISVEIDAGRKAVQSMSLRSPYLNRPNPKVDIIPRPLGIRSSVGLFESNQFVAAIIPKVSQFGYKLGLPLGNPISREEAERVVFVVNDSDIRIKLTNGYWFKSHKGVVVGFNSPASVYGRQPLDIDQSLRPVGDFLGEWKMTEKDATDLVHRAVEKLGFRIQDFTASQPPDVVKREQFGRYVIPRYYLRWITNNPATGGTIASVRAEVDADKGTVIHLELSGPPIRAMIGKGTNQPSVNGTISQDLPIKTPAWVPANSQKQLVVDGEMIKRSVEKFMVDSNKNDKVLPIIKRPNPYE